MDKSESQKLWEEVKENNRKLEACPGHYFSIDLTPERQMDKKYECTRCGGRVDMIRKKWYEKGLEHGRTTKQD